METDLACIISEICLYNTIESVITFSTKKKSVNKRSIAYIISESCLYHTIESVITFSTK